MKKQVFGLKTESGADALRRVAGVFSRKGCGIDSLRLEPDEPGFSSVTLTVSVSGEKARELEKLLGRLYDVVSVSVREEA
ncbi:MAG: hypothetical protein LBI36_04610 [Oscillospiraceae bacterium]|jgi:acetolactate synthase small subunit|nr:hypothetical protein [Oscillospiraceae bacterium]